MCWGSRRRRQRRTLGVFFSDVSCASHSTYSLNSSSALVARAAISKVRSRPASSLDSPARADPERHRRCPPFESFFDGRSRKKQRNSMFNTDRKNGFDERFWQKLNQKKQPGFLRGRVHIWFNTRLIRVDVEKQWTGITVRG